MKLIETRVVTMKVRQGQEYFPVKGELSIYLEYQQGDSCGYRGYFTFLEYRDGHLMFGSSSVYMVTKDLLTNAVDIFLRKQFVTYHADSFADWDMTDAELEYELKKTYNNDPYSLVPRRTTSQRWAEIDKKLHEEAKRLDTKEARQRAAKEAADWWASKAEVDDTQLPNLPEFRGRLESMIYNRLENKDISSPGIRKELLMVDQEPEYRLEQLVDQFPGITLAKNTVMTISSWYVKITDVYGKDRGYIYKQKLFDV